jgi:hypothetical protein
MNEHYRQISSSVRLTESNVDILGFALSFCQKSEPWFAAKYFLNLVSLNVVLEGEFTTVLSQTMPSMFMNVMFLSYCWPEANPNV